MGKLYTRPSRTGPDEPRVTVRLGDGWTAHDVDSKAKKGPGDVCTLYAWQLEEQPTIGEKVDASLADPGDAKAKGSAKTKGSAKPAPAPVAPAGGSDASATDTTSTGGE